MIHYPNKDIVEYVTEFTEYHSSLILSLIEILVLKGVLSHEDMTDLKNKQSVYISRFDQIQAENKDKLLNSDTDEGTKARMCMAMTSITNGDFKEFRKWIDLNDKIQNNK